MIDRPFCMSSYLMYRTVVRDDRSFGRKPPSLWADYPSRQPVRTSRELVSYMRESICKAASSGKKIALALSGGIDSAILARLVPEGTTAYTFKCTVPGIEVTDESPAAALYAKEAGLSHKVVEITWEDCEAYAPLLMKRKGAPIHSIEVQIYKAGLEAKADGAEIFLFGENADIIYGGMDGLLSKDWRFGEFVDRYSYVMPYKVLREPVMVLEPFCRHVRDGRIDPYDFINDVFRREAMGTYTNSVTAAGLELLCPFAETYLAEPIDYGRIRSGEGKYLVREVFNRLYPGFEIPVKLPMPRAVNEWLRDWEGPRRPEFWPHCTDAMTGDQKWLVWALEKYLDILDEEEKDA